MSEQWSDWITHDGSSCPVSKGTLVRVKYRNLSIKIFPAQSQRIRNGKVVGPYRNNKKYCSWHWALPENIVQPPHHIMCYQVKELNALEELRKIVEDPRPYVPEKNGAI